MKKLLFFSLVFSLAGLLAAKAQTVTPTFDGIVTDANNQPAAFVQVNVYLQSPNFIYTDAAGYYSITLPSLPIGMYYYGITAYGNNCQDSVMGGISPNFQGNVTITNNLQLSCTGNCNIAWGYNFDTVTCQMQFWQQGQPNTPVFWDFGDGTTSSQSFPNHVYTNPGTYVVTFQLNGCAPQTDTITVPPCSPQPVSCNYTWTSTPGNNLYLYYFAPSINGGSSFMWTFGDGDTSFQQAPIHQYANPGWYTVCLTIDTCPAYCDSFYVQPVNNNCNVAWGYYYDTLTCQFNFWHQGQNTSNVLWTFYDNNNNFIDSSLQHFPVYGWNSPGTYLVCFQIDNCPAVCDTIIVPNCSGCNSGNVCGMVTAGNNFGSPATVYLIQYDPQTNQLTAFQTTSTSPSGQYCFNNVPNGQYLVKAALTPNSNVWASYLPTYYGNVLFWSQALLGNGTVTVNCNTPTANISLIPGVNPGGPGFIGGDVLQGANLVDNAPDDVPVVGPVQPGDKAAGDPVPDVSVLLLDQNNNPVAHAVTDVNGEYGFTGIAFGTYQVYPEIPGLLTVPIVVTVDSQNPSIDDQDFTMNSTNITGLDENGNISGISVYPNPVADEASLYLDMENGSDLEIAVYSMTGSMVSTQVQKVISGANKVSVNTMNLASGIYTIAVKDLNTGHTGYIKIVK